MDCIEKTQEELYTHKFYYFIERTRHMILNTCYKIIVIKSRAKKAFTTLKKQIISLYL